MAVADDKAVRVHVGGEYSVQLGFGAGFKTKVIFLAVADNFFDHGAHLVDLDGVDYKVFGFVVILFGCLVEAVRGLFDTVIQYVGET